MSTANAVVAVDDCWSEPHAEGPPAILRGTARGLEMVVRGRATPDAITVALVKRLEEAPAFFRGSDVRVSVDDGPLAPGALARLDELATRFGLRIVEVAALAVPRPNIASGSAPNEFEEGPTQLAIEPVATSEPATRIEPLVLDDGDLTELVPLVDETCFDEPTQTAAPLTLAATLVSELERSPEGTRLVIGPIRSGVILDHTGHLIVFGDVNPGAEVRATGNIIVLGRLRGTAHAGIGQDMGFILALRLEPQQLRICRQVARPGDDSPPTDTEIAYATGGAIIVEQYLGRLPRNLATSI